MSRVKEFLNTRKKPEKKSESKERKIPTTERVWTGNLSFEHPQIENILIPELAEPIKRFVVAYIAAYNKNPNENLSYYDMYLEREHVVLEIYKSYLNTARIFVEYNPLELTVKRLIKTRKVLV